MGKGRSGAKSLPPLLDIGEILRDRFEVGAMIGGGGFGQIFRGYDKNREDDVAIKVEPAKVDKRRMRLEHAVLLVLRGRPHIPKIRSSGQIRGCSFIIMNLLGQNLSELRRCEKERKLSAGTTFRIAIKMSIGLRQMHEIGYLHRDVKPSNCCIGRADTECRDIYIVDFGMTRKFKNSDGTLRKPREHVGFRGTVRYASPTVHARKEPGPGDDFVGLLYSLVELVKGILPWTHLRDAKDVEEKKLDTLLEDLCENLPADFLNFAHHVFGLKYDQMPDYEKINALFQSCWPENISEATPYDWELGHDKSVNECRIFTDTGLNDQKKTAKSISLEQQKADGFADKEEQAIEKEPCRELPSPMLLQDQQQQANSAPTQQQPSLNKTDSNAEQPKDHHPDNGCDPNEPQLVTATI